MPCHSYKMVGDKYPLDRWLEISWICTNGRPFFPNSCIAYVARTRHSIQPVHARPLSQNLLGHELQGMFLLAVQAHCKRLQLFLAITIHMVLLALSGQVHNLWNDAPHMHPLTEDACGSHARQEAHHQKHDSNQQQPMLHAQGKSHDVGQQFWFLFVANLIEWAPCSILKPHHAQGHYSSFYSGVYREQQQDSSTDICHNQYNHIHSEIYWNWCYLMCTSVWPISKYHALPLQKWTSPWMALRASWQACCDWQIPGQNGPRTQSKRANTKWQGLRSFNNQTHQHCNPDLVSFGARISRALKKESQNGGNQSCCETIRQPPVMGTMWAKRKNAGFSILLNKDTSLEKTNSIMPNLSSHTCLHKSVLMHLCAFSSQK